MNFYFEAAKTLDRLDAKQGSIKGVIATLPEKDRKRTAALVIETLKCKNTTATAPNALIPVHRQDGVDRHHQRGKADERGTKETYLAESCPASRPRRPVFEGYPGRGWPHKASSFTTQDSPARGTAETENKTRR